MKIIVIIFIIFSLQLYGQNPVLIHDINPSGGGALVTVFKEYKDKLYFPANDGVNGIELWESDGDTAIMVIDLNPTGSSHPGGFVIWDSILYFSADDGVNGKELWKFDGVNASLAYDINPTGGSYPIHLTVLDSVLLFKADDGFNGAEPWIFNGVSATLLKDINPNGSSNLSRPVFINGISYFTATDSTTATFPYKLWKYDGDSVTKIDFNPFGASSASSLVEFSNKLFFSGRYGSTTDLWSFDGINAIRIKDSIANTGQLPSNIYPTDSVLYFSADDGINGRELWLYDLDTSYMIQDIFSGNNPSSPSALYYSNGNLFFYAQDGNGSEFHIYDGDNIISYDLSTFGSSLTQFFHEFNGDVYFRSVSTLGYQSLFKYSNSNINLININPSGNSDPAEFISFNDKLIFRATNGLSGYELWKIDSCGNDADYIFVDNGNGNFSFTNTSIGSFNQSHWAFGDGNTSTSPNPNHTFSADGIYPVVLTINDSVYNGSCFDFETDNIIVNGVLSPSSCVSGFVMYPDTNTSNNVTVVNSSTGNNLTYYWEFGDGDTSNLFTPSHIYQNSGSYYLCLTIDDGSCQDIFCDSVGINGVVFKQNGFTINVIPGPFTNSANYTNVNPNFINIYPNPTLGQLEIETELNYYKIDVVDIMGKIQITIAPKGKLNISSISKGLYFLKFYTNNGIVSKTIIKQ